MVAAAVGICTIVLPADVLVLLEKLDEPLELLTVTLVDVAPEVATAGAIRVDAAPIKNVEKKKFEQIPKTPKHPRIMLITPIAVTTPGLGADGIPYSNGWTGIGIGGGCDMPNVVTPMTRRCDYKFRMMFNSREVEDGEWKIG